MPDGSVVGITSTVPVEIILAGGFKPVDLNNLFITSEMPEKLIRQAESEGFAHNICAWIKGIYATVINHHVKTVIAVTGGDCSNTIALSELFLCRGIRMVPFHYPINHHREPLSGQLNALGEALSTTWPQIVRTKRRLDSIRHKLIELDRLTYEQNVVTGLENHRFLVSSSDFASDPDKYETDLDVFLSEARRREPKGREIRLGYLGVPPIFEGFYETVESFGARVVFNEVQRQFSMPYEEEDIVAQYLRYTYPYEIGGRIQDIKEAIEKRKLDGLIHYTQTFCFRQIHDIILREYLHLPMLTLEGDRPGILDGRTAARLEIFIEMLKDRKWG